MPRRARSAQEEERTMAPSNGDTVRVHYKGTLEDGSVFDSSEGRDPLEFQIGAGQVIPGFNDAAADLGVGDSVTVTISACDAYGDRMDEAVQTVPLSAFPEAPEEGMMVELQAPDGRTLAALIASVGEENAELDFNHPLAGKDLTFDIEMVEVVAGEAADADSPVAEDAEETTD
jgi:peptidylprolyl isomerase